MLSAILILAVMGSGGAQSPLSHAEICKGSPDPISGEDLVARLERSGLYKAKKDEFETTAQYQARLEGMARSEHLFPIVSAAIGVAPHRLSYDADLQELSLEVARSDYRVDRSHQIVTEISRSSVDLGTYVGQNAYGARSLVEDRAQFEHVISWGKDSGASGALRAVVSMAPDVARKLKAEGVSLIFSGRVIEPIVEMRTGHSAPTTSDPTRRSISSLAIFAKPECIYLKASDGKNYGLRVKR
jgi:hypothetical protein